MAVIDSTAIAKLGEQLSALKRQYEALSEQIGWLNTMSAQLHDQIDAIGRAGRITIPNVDLERMGQRLLRDAECLTPDLSKLMPGVSLDDLTFASICEGRHAYETTLWFDPAAARKRAEAEIAKDEAVSRDARDRAVWEAVRLDREAIEDRRERLARDTAATGMAKAALAATQGSLEARAAIGELADAGDAALNGSERLAVIIQGLEVESRLAAENNQLLAQLLKVQSTMLLMMTLPAGGLPGEDDDDGGAP